METKLLAVGMEHSNIAGNCAGASLDAKRMFDLISPKASFSKLLLNKEAKKDDVCNYLKEICDSDLAIFFYAGHGASKRIRLNASEETDGKDEMVCLYDGLLIDNEIWDIVSKAKGRVFCIFDCCHSETMFRVGKKSIWNSILSFLGFTIEEKIVKYKPIMITSRTSETVDLMCWSGCADDKTSMGSSSGGVFTNTILKYVESNLTYDEVWKKISNDKDLARKEIVKETILMGNNSSFVGKNIFS